MENNMEKVNTGLPATISFWSKLATFLTQEITVTLTPKQEKVFKEVHDFWHQEITAEKVKSFLFKEIEITDNITL